MQQQPLAFSSAQPITPSNSTFVSFRSIYIGGAGTLVVTFGPPGNPTGPVTFTGLTAGSWLPLMLDQGLVNTASTATGLIALA